MSLQQREVLEEGLSTFREVFDTNKVSVTREQMRRLLNLEIIIDQLISGLKAIEGKSKEDLIKLVDESTTAASVNNNNNNTTLTTTTCDAVLGI